MAIIINIDVVLAKQKMSVTELAEKEGITMANISILKNGKAKAIRLSPPCSGSRLARTKGPSLDARYARHALRAHTDLIGRDADFKCGTESN